MSSSRAVRLLRLALSSAAFAALLSAGCGARSSLFAPEGKEGEGGGRGECTGAGEGDPCTRADACCSGQCNGGVCGPPLCAPGDPPITLVAGPERLAGLLADGSHIYFTHYNEEGAVRRVPKSGGAVEMLVPVARWSEALVPDASDLYFMDDDRLSRVAKGGGEVTVVAAEQDGSLEINLYEDRVYWINPTDKMLWWMPKSGGTPQALIMDPMLSTDVVPRLLVDDTRVYWSAFSLRAAPREGGGAAITITEEPTSGLAKDAEHLYWAQPGQLDFKDLLKLEKAAGVVRADKDGSNQVMLAENSWDQIGPSIAQDEGHLYWTDPLTEELFKVSKAGGAKVKLADVKGRPYMLAVDATCVYLVGLVVLGDGVEEGSIVRLPRSVPGEPL